MSRDGLTDLERDYPGMRFGTVRASAGSGRRRRFWARRLADGVLLTAWPVPALRERIQPEPPVSPEGERMRSDAWSRQAR